MAGNKRGYTSYVNDSIRDSSLPDHLYRFKMVLESHMGASGTAIVKISTLALEMNKNRRSAERALKWFLQNSNLKVRKKRFVYEYYTEPDMSVAYGETKVSHIVVHGSRIIKRTIEKDISKNPKDVFSNKEEERGKPPELSGKDRALVDEVADWLALPAFKPILTREKLGFAVRGLLLKYGYTTLEKVYKQVAIYGADPFPKKFWDGLKQHDNMASVPK